MLLIILIGISLSMDAFSLALAYGTLNLKNRNINILTIIVGLYHFFMPLISMNIGKTITIFLKSNVLVFIILFLIGIEMILETFKEKKEVKHLNLFEMILFGLAVSIDSFSLGFGLKTLYKNPYISALTFSISSMIFTFLGLKLGQTINKKIGSISTILGGIILIIIGIIYLV